MAGPKGAAADAHRSRSVQAERGGLRRAVERHARGGALRVGERAVLDRRGGAAAGRDPRPGAHQLPRRGHTGTRGLPLTSTSAMRVVH